MKNATDHDVTLHLGTGYYKRSLCRRAYSSSFIRIVFYATHRNFLMVCYFLFIRTMEKILHCNKWINVFSIFLNHPLMFYESSMIMELQGVHLYNLYFTLWNATLQSHTYKQNSILCRLLVFYSLQERMFYILGINYLCCTNKPPRGISSRWSPQHHKSLVIIPGENCKSLGNKQTNFIYIIFSHLLSAILWYTDVFMCSHLMLCKLLSFYLLPTKYVIIINLDNLLALLPLQSQINYHTKATPVDFGRISLLTKQIQ